MSDFFENPLWAIVTGICFVAVCVTVYHLNIDPKVAAMTECTRGLISSETRVGCAHAIYGDAK